MRELPEIRCRESRRGTHRGKIEQVNLDEKKERILSLSLADGSTIRVISSLIAPASGLF